MTRFRRRLNSHLWAALLAVGGLAFVPTVSRLLQPAVDHCAAMTAVFAPSGEPATMASTPVDHDGAGPMGHGMSAAAVHTAHAAPADEAAPASAPRPALASLDHCSLCVVAALAILPVPETADLPAPAAAAAPAVSPRQGSAERRDDWSPASWRGPPRRA